jgi:hypothetical protein
MPRTKLEPPVKADEKEKRKIGPRAKPTMGTAKESMNWPVGAKPWTVRVYERPDRDGAVYIHWRDKETQNAKRKALTGYSSIRKKGGGIDVKLRQEAINQATEWQQQWELGAPEPMDEEDYRALTLQLAEAEVARRERVANGEEDAGAPTQEFVPDRVREFIHQANYSVWTMMADVFGPVIPKEKNLRRRIRGQMIPAGPSGAPPHYKTYHQFSVERRDAATVVERILGARTRVRDLSNHSADVIADTMMREAAARGRTSGWRQAEHAIDAFHFAIRRTRRGKNALVVPRDIAPDVGWKRKLRADWAQVTGERGNLEPKRERHQPADAAKLYRAIELKQGPWRIRLALALGGPARLGQVARALRSQVVLDAPGFPHGSFEIIGKGQRRGTLYALTTRERAALDDALETHLKPFEEAHQAGVIKDYPLVPGGRTWNGVYRVKPGVVHKSVGRTRLTEEFWRLEEISGCPHVPRRAWNGLRRVFSDLNADAMARVLKASDVRILDSLSGHTPTSLRGQIYQDNWRVEVLIPAMRVRKATEDFLLKLSPRELIPTQHIAPGLHRTIGAWSKEKRRVEAKRKQTNDLEKFFRDVAKIGGT